MGGVGRNDPCPCGSGEKFKRCHGAERSAAVSKVIADRHMEAASRAAHDQLTRLDAAALAEVWGAAGAHPEEPRKGTEDLAEFIEDWLIYDAPLGDDGRSLIAGVATTHPDASTRAAATALAESGGLRLMRVVAVTAGAWMEYEPYLGGQRVRITSARTSTQVTPGDLVATRLPDGYPGAWARVIRWPATLDRAVEDWLIHHGRRLGLDLTAESCDLILRRSFAAAITDPPRPPIPLPVLPEGDPLLICTAAAAIDPASHGALTPFLQPDGSLVVAGDPPPPIDRDATPMAANALAVGKERTLMTGQPSTDGRWELEALSQRRFDLACLLLADHGITLEDLDGPHVADPLEAGRALNEHRRREAGRGHGRRARPPEDQQDLRYEDVPQLYEEIARVNSEAWLGQQIPLFDGLTPRQVAASNGPHSATLRNLLYEMDARNANSPHPLMDVELLRRELGL